MRSTGRPVHLLSPLVVLLMFRAPVAAAPPTVEPGKLPNGFSGHAIVAASASWAHDRSRAFTFAEIQHQISNDIKFLADIKNTPPAVADFLCQILQYYLPGEKHDPDQIPLPPAAELPEDLKGLASLLPYLLRNERQNLLQVLNNLKLPNNFKLDFDRDIAPILSRVINMVPSETERGQYYLQLSVLRRQKNTPAAVLEFLCHIIHYDPSMSQLPADLRGIAPLLPDLLQKEKANLQFLRANLDLQFLRDVVPILLRAANRSTPTEAFGLEWNYRHIWAKPLTPQGTSSVVSLNIPRLIYSNVRTGTDFLFQALPGGIGLGLSIEPFVYRFSDFNAPLESDTFETMFEKAKNFANSTLRPRFSLLAGYRNVPEVGRTWDTGISLSYLRPLGERPASGIQFQVAVQPIWFTLRTGNLAAPYASSSFVAVGGSIAWQDQTPFAEPKEPKMTVLHGVPIERKDVRIRRWRLRVALEYGRVPLYPFRDGFGDTWAVSVRSRDRGSGEYALVYGRTATNDEFFGLSVGTFFRW